jgi:serine/threonine protein kinase
VSALVEQIGSALSVAHALGVVHRDIKPANVLFDEAGNAHLADFGIATSALTDESTALYSAGSAHYASPEQFRGAPTSARSDLYSFAATIWHLLAGRPPFEGDSRSEIGRLKLERRVPSLQPIRPDLGGAIDVVLQKATAPAAAERFASVNEFVLAWRAAFDAMRTSTATNEPPSEVSIRRREADTMALHALAALNPYKGLHSFTEADERNFFGRAALANELTARVSSSRATTVVGASGAGKTSSVASGLGAAVARVRRSRRCHGADRSSDRSAAHCTVRRGGCSSRAQAGTRRRVRCGRVSL